VKVHGLALSGNHLFVANYGISTVGEYKATTGAAINANFVTGLNSGAFALELTAQDRRLRVRRLFIRLI
jgi:hypothetical protein